MGGDTLVVDGTAWVLAGDAPPRSEATKDDAMTGFGGRLFGASGIATVYGTITAMSDRGGSSWAGTTPQTSPLSP
jgi:hypothetical protein